MATTQGDNVVINILGSNINNPSFGGTLLLTGGLTADQVLFNIVGGSNLTNGPTLTISTNGSTINADFLDPNGSVSENHSLVVGRIFGGDSSNMQIVSGAQINAPAPAATPEPSTVISALVGLAAVGVLKLRRRSR